MKRVLMSVAFTCVLSSFALAGDIPISGSPSPSPQRTEAPAPGYIPSGGVAEQLSSEALSALLEVLTFLTV